MAFDQFYAIDSSNQMFEVTLRSATTGQLLTGIAYDAITARYIREGSDTQVTVSVVAASQGVYTSGGWVETGIAGVYQFGIPNTALAGGAKAVTLVFSASGAIDVVKRIVLVSEDLRDALISNAYAQAYLATEYASDARAYAGRVAELVQGGGELGPLQFSAQALELAPAVDAQNVADALLLTPDGAAADGSAMAYLAAIEAAAQDLQAQVGTDGAGLTAIGDARLVNLDAAVSSRLASASYTAPLDATATQAAAAAALTAYDPPTKAELDAAVAPLATAAALAVVDSNLDAVKHITDQLDTSAVTQVPASSAGHLLITAGLTFDEPVSGLAIPADWTKAYWTLKSDEAQPDTAAIVQLLVSNPPSLTDGLQRLNGAVPAAPITLASGALTVDQPGGRITIHLADELTVLLNKAGSVMSRAGALGWDVKFIDESGESVGRRGTAAVVLTETKATA